MAGAMAMSEQERELRERIAQEIEECAQYEGVRAQRVIRMCAFIARGDGRESREAGA